MWSSCTGCHQQLPRTTNFGPIQLQLGAQQPSLLQHSNMALEETTATLIAVSFSTIICGGDIVFYHQISWSLEIARLDVTMIVWFWNLTGISVALLLEKPKPESRGFETSLETLPYKDDTPSAGILRSTSQLSLCQVTNGMEHTYQIISFNTLRARQNGRHFADDTFNRIFVNENVRIPIKFSLKFVSKGPINNIPALVQIMASRRPGDKP